MGKAITSILAVGIGAAAYSMMRSRNRRKQMMNMIEPLSKMIPRQRTRRMIRSFT